MKRAKIIATIGPVSESPEVLRALIRAGLDVARINMSHGTHERHAEAIRRVREAAEAERRPVAVMLDLCGPKMRTGMMKPGGALLQENASVNITGESILGDSSRFSTNYPALAKEVEPGDRILLDDGQIELEVLATDGAEIQARVIQGGTLGDNKGLNLPRAHLSISSLTEKDMGDLEFGIRQGADIIAQSFVRSAADCRLARERIAGLGSDAQLIAKIEKPEAIRDLPAIFAAADGVMVARGDLAVETSPELVPLLQKKIIADALSLQKTAITATQMLQSMVEGLRPTRAEASDVANAVLDGCDALMLSAETAIGKFPVETVSMMDRIIRATEAGRTDEASDACRAVAPNLPKAWGLIRRQSGSLERALAEAAVFASEELGAKLIVVFTTTGFMARSVAALRPAQRIIALTPSDSARRRLALTWGIEPYLLAEFSPVSENMMAAADRLLLDHKLASSEENVIVIAGRIAAAALSNAVKIHRIGRRERD